MPRRAKDRSYKRMLANVLSRFFPGGKFKAVKTARCQTRKPQIPKAVDAEASVVPLRRRVLVQDGIHKMGHSSSSSDDEEDVLEQVYDYFNSDNYVIDDKEQLEVIRMICKATSMDQVQSILDNRVKDDWLGGLDSLPGNVYMIAALNWRHLDTRWQRGMAKRLGMLAVLVLQLLGPPVIFFQSWMGFGLDDHQKLDWKAWKISLTDWAVEEEYYLTKFIALLFLFCFILNGLFCHLDEKSAWHKVTKIFNMLNHNGEMKDTCTTFLYLSAFMNSWVIVWLCIDVWLVLGVSDSVLEVLMDALGLAFLYNLDDVGSDLRFVDEDDWPGLQLAWVDKMKEQVEAQYADIDLDETDPPQVCDLFLTLIARILGLFSFVLPILFIVTPFKAMRPDPFFETITKEMLINGGVNATALG